MHLPPSPSLHPKIFVRIRSSSEEDDSVEEPIYVDENDDSSSSSGSDSDDPFTDERKERITRNSIANTAMSSFSPIKKLPKSRTPSSLISQPRQKSKCPSLAKVTVNTAKLVVTGGKGRNLAPASTRFEPTTTPLSAFKSKLKNHKERKSVEKSFEINLTRTNNCSTPPVSVKIQRTADSEDDDNESGPEPPKGRPKQKPAAHQNAPDQSTRMLSGLIEEMSNNLDGNDSSTLVNILSAQIRSKSELDAWFLRGGAAELGIAINAVPIADCVCARGLWQSHWREEWCAIFNSFLAFYVPLSKKPALVLYYRDIMLIRCLSQSLRHSPLPGLSLLAIETPGRVHYLAFSKRSEMEDFESKVKASIIEDESMSLPFATSASSSMTESTATTATNPSPSLQKRSGDEGVQQQLQQQQPQQQNTPSSDPRENFVLKSGQWASANKSNRRVVLNARKMKFDGSSSLSMSCFDRLADDEFVERTPLLGAAANATADTISGATTSANGNATISAGAAPGVVSGATVISNPPKITNTPSSSTNIANNADATLSIAVFVENLLVQALSLSPDSSLDELIQFLNAASCLRSINLRKINFDSEEAVCIFVNLYHALLQHALLLLGPPSKSSVTHFMRCVCYEVGCDVFSLAEIEHCVLRGKTTSLHNGKLPYVTPLKTSSSFTNFYGLSAVDARINFVLNHGFIGERNTVPILRANNLHSQLNKTSTDFIQHILAIDSTKRVVVLPEVCKLYRYDFGDGGVISILKMALRFLDRDKWEALSWLLADEERGVSVKYKSNTCAFVNFLAADIVPVEQKTI